MTFVCRIPSVFSPQIEDRIFFVNSLMLLELCTDGHVILSVFLV